MMVTLNKKIFLMILFSISFMSFAQNGRGGQIDMEEVKENFSPLPESHIDQQKYKNVIQLGERLYFEKALSINNQMSCNTCHRIDKFGVDNEATSPGHEGKRGDRNSPTTFNASLHIAQFWDGRAKDVEEQALGPILNPVEMGMPSEKEVVKKLKSTSDYTKAFALAFPEQKEALSYKNIGVAIGAYEKTLITPSRFDKFLKGDMSALNQQEKRGLKKFMHKGCVSCHNGPLLGGNDYQLLGAANEYQTHDLGRYNVTKEESDKKVFKVPSLRNVLETGPYFHDGSIKTVDEAIKLMAYHQLDENVGEGFIQDVKAFLGTLTT
ncbi:MAG: cytochrome-c peroxidase, partial [Halobacteriovoraceae bacterium]|nr:cytochrome-c peroxidase [Halobacteriovoraceae bacterium]